MAYPTPLQQERRYQWPPLDPQLKLPEGEIHIWHHCLLDSPWADLVLSDPGEEQRAQKYLTLQLQQHYRAAHGFKRAILSRYCSLPPERLCFTQWTYGKPALQHPLLHFNLSHSHGWCAIAIAGFNVGIDIEAIAADSSWQNLRSHCVHPREQVLNSAQFYQHWCAKEAVGKWDGRGLGLSFSHLYLEPISASAPHWRPHYQTQNPQQKALAASQVIAIPHPSGLAAALAWGPETAQIISYLP